MYKYFTQMSKPTPSTSRKPARPAITPLIGSLLRLPHEVVVARMLAALDAHGFDITLTELGLFLYPGPDGRRPIDLARQCDMTRQAMNYVLSGLENRDYIERRAGSTPVATVVRLTDKGWEAVAEIRSCVTEIEKEWAAYLGAPRFKSLQETLRDLSQWLGKLT
jgi:DNA-binding MarR family transcriptional regulator